jgi:PKD repeat protein
MKKKLLSLLTMVFCALSFIVLAQNPPCSLKAKFDFKADNCKITFADLSAAAAGTSITSWSWDFGDATTSTLPNPTHVYTTSGTFTVCLTIVGNNGLVRCKDRFCLPVTVKGCEQVQPCGVKPLFQFKVDKCTVYFTDLSGTNAGTTITNWYWNFGDASTSTLQNPIHTYAAAGTYSVCLITVAKNTAGEQCKNEYCFPVKVEGCGNNPFCKLAAKFDFKADKCKVGFTDLSTAGAGTTITSWHWDFGDATTSTVQNPTHVFTTAGTYNVCLVVIGVNAIGKQCRDQFCQKVTVEGCSDVPCKLAAKFQFKMDKCTVGFSDLSAAGAGTSITNWYWDFGDSTTSTLQNPTHVYTTAGTYSVCLTIIGSNGVVRCKDQFCQKVTVEGCGQVEPCKLAAKFQFKIDKCTVGFSDLSAAGAGTSITNWHWDFGDATTSSLQNPTHVYAVAGTYNVCLTIIGNNGLVKCKDQFCQKVTVEGCGQVEPCKLAAKFDLKVDKCNVSFIDLSATGVGTTITSWFWTFGDATSSALQNPTHAYAAAGAYTVCLTIVGTNANGQQCKDQFCQKITVEGCGQVEPCKLAAKFNYKMDKCTVGFADLSGAGLGTTITNWYWDFGDATTSTLQHPTHVYAAAGTYTVCLTIVGTNGNGEQCKDQFCDKVTVEGCGQTEPCKLYPKFNFKQDSCTIYFVDLSTTGLGTTITNWYWDFGDATTSTLQNPAHMYATSGTYTVCLIIVGNNAGVQCREQYCMKIDAKGCGQDTPCQVYAKFDYKIDSCNVYFTDYSATGAGTTITSWFWDFGDGNTSTLQSPVHSYLTPGVYNVCLLITGVNAAGIKCENKICLQIAVKDCGGQQHECKLYAKFDFKVDSCKVYFADFSGTGAGTTITNWYWDFGDGNTSTAQHPSHVYATSGTYTVCLIIVGVNAAGEQCKDKICNTLTVTGCGQDTPCQVYAKFDYKIDGCGVYFTDYSATGAGTTIASWFWDFGDGNTSTLQNPSHVYATPGTYVVCLYVVGVNANGVKCENKLCLTIIVKDCGQTSDCKLYPKFDYKTDSCNVSFFDFSGVAVGTTITSWFWDFGDGNTSTLQNPAHVYAASGNYTVCLLITGVNAAGVKCENKICLPVSVQDCKQGITTGKANASFLTLYPNPAKDIVNISFKMNVAGQVNITVSDIQGRTVAIVKDAYFAYGYHNIEWNVNVHAGWYLITIKTAEGRDQKQVLIQQ